jgi:hypothetical protein
VSATTSSRNSRLSSEGSFADTGNAAEDIMSGGAGATLRQRGWSQSRPSGTGIERNFGGHGNASGSCSSNARDMSAGERGDPRPLAPPGLACGWRGSGLGVLGAGEAGFL